MSAPDPTADLERFVAAQDAPPPGCGGYETACAELRTGRKRSHWIWWILPQLRGLGGSHFSTFYGIGSLAEARAYLAHPVLGPRLLTVVDLLLARAEPAAAAILGDVDAMKLRSSMTLFGMAAPGEPRFRAVLERFFDGRPDPATEALLDPD